VVYTTELMNVLETVFPPAVFARILRIGSYP